MAKTKKSKKSKSSVKVRDLSPRKNARGGNTSKAVLTTRKAGGGQQDYLIVTMEDVKVSN